MAKESAEEKLLKMMHKPSPSVAVKSSTSATPKKKFKFAFSVGALNSFLFLGIFLCIIALGFEMHAGFSLLHQAVEFPPESKNGVSLSDIALPSSKSADYYLHQIN